MREHRSSVVMLALSLLAVSASTGMAATGRSLAPVITPPAGQPPPAQLVGLYAAHFTAKDDQTAGTWHLRVGPGHHLKIWNRLDPIADSPSFEAGPVSFRGSRMIFAKTTAEGICSVGASYGWTYRGGLLRFRLIGADDCQPRVITFTPHPWHRSP